MNFFQFLSNLRFARYIKLIFFFGDLFIIVSSFILSQYLRFGNSYSIDSYESRTILLLSIIFWIGLVLYFEAYEFLRTGRMELFILKTIRVIFLHIVLIAFLILALKFYNTSRLGLIYFYAFAITELILLRVLLINILKLGRRLGYNYRIVAFLGYNQEADKIKELLISDLSRGFRIAGYFSEEKKEQPKINYLGGFDQIENYLNQNNVDEIYISLNDKFSEVISRVIVQAERKMTRVKIIPNFQQYTKIRKLNLDFYENLPVLLLLNEPLENPINKLLKRLFDLFFSIIVIVFIFPWLFPILILLIKFTSKGPVFFRQIRTGEDGNDFVCLKFRTMKVNSLSDELQATKNDKRITPIGAFLRKSNLDELPQFFNVFFGQMSVVGPRPHMLKHTEDFSNIIDQYPVRHFTKPGITGWAQVSGYRGETKDIVDIEKRVEHDIWYIENWTFYLDVKIIFKTVWKIFRGDKNAY